MKSEKFAEWLKAYMDALSGPPSKEQWHQIREVLASVDKEPAFSEKLFGPPQPLVAGLQYTTC